MPLPNPEGLNYPNPAAIAQALNLIATYLEDMLRTLDAIHFDLANVNQHLQLLHDVLDNYNQTLTKILNTK